MRRSLTRFAAMAALALGLFACTDQQRARHWGGTADVNLPKGARVVTVTWKEDNLWILTKQEPDIPAQRYELTESSSFGVVEGKVVLVER